MNPSPEPGLSKGVMMIAAYRAARLGQRPRLPTSLPQFRTPVPEGQVPEDPRPAEPGQPSPTTPATGLAPEMKDTPSIFANLVNSGVAEISTGIVTKRADLEAADDHPPSTAEAQLPTDYPEPAVPEAADVVLHDPPLAEIGFGPGMLIRLSQLGLHTMSDLARSDATQLRAALGDISRLLDVEAWIGSARRIATWAQTPGQVVLASQA
jgi:hypothetical protein